MYEACKETRVVNKTLKQHVTHIGNRLLTHVEISAHLILQLSLRVSNRSFVFINTNPSEIRTFLKPLEVLREIPDYSTNIQYDNAMKRYKKTPKCSQKLLFG